MKNIPPLIIALLGFLASAFTCFAQTPDDFSPDANGRVYGLAVQPDQKVLIAGDFTSVGGVSCNRVARLNADGTLDVGFNPTANGVVYSVALQSDGKILVGGGFTGVGEVARNRILRLNADGTLDTSFNPNANDIVHGICVQSDGRILVSGIFTNIGGATRNRIARLNTDGTLDTSFNPNANNSVYGVCLQADGKILVGGNFTNIGGATRNRIARLNTDGTLDTSFNPNANNIVHGICVQADGRILVGGLFTTIGGVVRNCIARLNADGTLDTNFNPNAGGSVQSLAVQTDGKIFVGGSFTTIGGMARNRIARLNSEGTLDTSFNPNASTDVYGMAIQADGKILVGGNFSSIGGVTRNRIARLSNDVKPIQTLTCVNGSQIDWIRDGSAPEVDPVTFDWWNGNSWVSAGTATRAAGGWRKTGLSLPASSWVRARGRAMGGQYNGSTGIIEQVASFGNGTLPDVAVTADGSALTSGNATVDFGDVIWPNHGIPKTFTITNAGDAPLSGLMIAMSGTGAAHFSTTDPISAVLPPGQSTTFTVQFSPQVAGDSRARLTLVSNDGDESPFSINCSGTCVHLEPDFNPNAAGFYNYGVHCIAPQPDGKILVGGDFRSMGGASRNAIARLNPDGSVDGDFNPNFGNNTVFSLAVQPDGKILVAGTILIRVGNKFQNYITRLNADGSLDPNFTPPVFSGTNGLIYSMALQPNGQVLIGGYFTTIDGMVRNNVARLNANGTLDTGFNPNANNSVRGVGVQADGKPLLWGDFTTVGGVTRNRIARLNADGTLDTGFNPNANNSVSSVAVQPDGKILAGGYFTSIGGSVRKHIARLNANGTLDAGFNPNADYPLHGIALQADGRIVIGGYFSTIGGVTRNCIARLNPDGTLDAGFNPKANSDVYAIALQPDGRILIGGRFSAIGGVTRNGIARLPNDVPPVQSLGVAGTSQIDWIRNGSAPEVEQVTFDTWGGSQWVNRGPATRVAGGWRMTGLSLPASAWVRARAKTTGGAYNGSSGLLEQIAGYGGDSFSDISVSVAGMEQKSGASTVDFGTLNWSDSGTPKTFTVTNSGNAPLNALEVSMTGAGDFIATLPGKSELQPGESTTFTMQFTSQGAGLRNARLEIKSNDLDESPFLIGCIGKGIHQDQDFNPGANSSVYCMALQRDGKILVGGQFTTISGVVRNRLARLYPDGSADPAFTDPAFSPVGNLAVYGTAVQADGRIVVGGDFTTVGGVTRNRMARLYADGTLDPSFNPNVNGVIYGIAIQPDSKILLWGDFTSIGGVVRNRVGRLNADGSLDAGFNPNADRHVYSLALRSDGKMYVAGFFTRVGSTYFQGIARLNADGTCDTSFNPNSNPSDVVYCVAPQPDGKIIISGRFAAGNSTIHRIARLNSNGTLDPGFSHQECNWVTSIVLQADGKILAGGWFSTVGKTDRNRIARLHADGTLDMSFDPNANGAVTGLALQPDGSVLAAGWFSALGGVLRSCIARLPNDDAAIQMLTVIGTNRIDWTRGGGTPEVEQVSFDSWNGSNWVSQGVATRVAGGWSKTNLSLSGGSWVRARARTAGGQYNGGHGMIEQIASYGASMLPDIAVEVDGSAQTSGDAIVDFGSTGWETLGEPKTLTITNAGGAPLSGLVVSMAGIAAGDYDFTQPAANVLAPGQSTTFTVRFTPKSAGIRSSVLSITSNDGDESPFIISFKGIGRHDDPGFNAGFDNSVQSVAVQPDGKILVAGNFTTIGGVARSRIARLYGDGTCEAGFNPDANNLVSGIALQPDGKILVAGSFTTIGGVSRNRIARLHADGTLDSEFNPNANDRVFGMALQPDGKILVAGHFTTIGGAARNRVARLNPDGTLDSGFDPNSNSSVVSMALQTDGKILLGGEFTSIGGVVRNRIARLHADGTCDPGFNPDASSTVYGMVLQPDGKILVAGNFTTIGGAARNRIARLNAGGTLDAAFNPDANDMVNGISLQVDGRILVGGWFTTIGGVVRNYIARLNADGTLDAGFNPSASSQVAAIALQPDGMIIIGGNFTTIGGAACKALSRLYNAEATQTLTIVGASQIDWTRGGSSQEVEQVTFETWNGNTWVSHGTATRVAGGWRKTDLVLPASTWLRARGRASGGYYNGSFSLIEQVITYGGGSFPGIAVKDQSKSELVNGSDEVSYGPIAVGSSASHIFTIQNTGAADLSNLAVTIDGPDAGTFVAGSLGATTLAPGTSTTFTVDFTPARAGSPTATVRIASNVVAESPFAIALTGSGYLVPKIAIEQPVATEWDAGSTYDFGMTNLGSTLPKVFTLRNAGEGMLDIGAITISGDCAGDFILTTAGTATRLAPGGSTTVLVIFNPSLDGPRTASLTILNNDPDENPYTLALTGNGNHPPTFAGYTISTAYETAATISLDELLSVAADDDGDALLVSTAGPASTERGNAVLQSESVVYTPPAGFSGTDTFPITIADVHGGSVQGTVTVTVGLAPEAGGQGAPQLTMLEGNRVGIAFDGIPGLDYKVERATDLTDWATLATITASETGAVNFIDESPPPSSAFYRLRKP